MSTKYKRFISLVIAFVMTFLTLAPTTTLAYEFDNSECNTHSLLTTSKNVLYTTTGSDISENTKAAFSAYNVTIDEHTLIEIIPLDGCTTGDAVVITNVKDGELTQSQFMAVNENLEIQSFHGNANSTRAVNDGDFMTETLDNSLVIQITVAFDSYNHNGFVNYLFKPKTVMMIYYDDDNLYDVTRAEIYYDCIGYKYVFNEETEKYEKTNVYVEHSIPLIKSNPNPRTYYSASNPYTAGLINSYNPASESHYVSYYFAIRRGNTSGNLRNTWVIGFL